MALSKLASTLDGPRLAPARGKATHLVVLCHGYGADGKDLISLAAQWRDMLPTCAFAAPNAPERTPSTGYQWFALSRLDPHELKNGVEAASPILESFLDAELANLGLGWDRLALVGFSQGTMLSLHVGCRRSPAAIIGFSGLLAAPPPNASPDRASFPPILLTHGDADSVIPASAMLASAAMLGRAGAGVQWHLAPGVGHGLDEPTLALAGNFLRLAFQGLLKPEGEIACNVG